MFWVELLVVLAMLIIGARYGGIFLGMSSGFAIAILVFGFGLAPGNPAIDVIMIIMTVVVIAATLQASGGMDYLIQIAVKLLRKNPNRISYYAPIISWVFTFMCGTGNISFGILPVIAEVAREAGVRPERPISMSVIASQQAITACPISAATVALVGLLAPAGVTLIDILIVCIPSTKNISTAWPKVRPLRLTRKRKSPRQKNFPPRPNAPCGFIFWQRLSSLSSAFSQSCVRRPCSATKQFPLQ